MASWGVRSLIDRYDRWPVCARCSGLKNTTQNTGIAND
jgi:hypothetical protein